MDPSSDAGPASPRRGNSRFWPAVLLALVPFALLVWKFNWLTDDAFISFRYAKHFVEGHGLRYNLGPHTPVEGYSNFLWNVWLGVLHFIHLDMEVWSRLCSVLGGAALLAFATRFAARSFDLGFRDTLLTALFFATLPTVAVWSTGGLETIIASLLFFAVFERLLGDPGRPRGIQAGLIAVLFGLVREEGVGFMAVLLGIAFLTWLATRRAGLLRAILLTFLIFAAAMILNTAWRYAYFGDFLSNTARLKAGFHWLRIERGGCYAASFFLTVPSCLLVLLLGIPRRGRPNNLLALQAAAAVGANLAFAVYAGGDFMPMGRFMAYSMPFLALLFAGALSGLGKGRSAYAVGLGAFLIALSLLPSFDIHPVPKSLRQTFTFRWKDPTISDFTEMTEHGMWKASKQAIKRWTRLGRALKRNTRPGESIILGAIGAIGYYSDLFVYDTYGLTSREVALRDTPPLRSLAAHDRAVPLSFFLKDKPTYLAAIILKEGAVKNYLKFPEGWLPGVEKENYRVETHPLPEEDGSKAKRVLVLVRYLPE